MHGLMSHDMYSGGFAELQYNCRLSPIQGSVELPNQSNAASRTPQHRANDCE